MGEDELSDSRVHDLVSIYAEAAAAHGRMSNQGVHEAANDQVDILATAYRELRERGA
jgi:hypothetical protein